MSLDARRQRGQADVNQFLRIVRLDSRRGRWESRKVNSERDSFGAAGLAARTLTEEPIDAVLVGVPARRHERLRQDTGRLHEGRVVEQASGACCGVLADGREAVPFLARGRVEVGQHRVAGRCAASAV